MIATEQSAQFGIEAEDKPTGKTTSLTGSIIRIDWNKGKSDGIYIDSQRSDETEWTRLDFDMHSPYEDVRPRSPPVNPKSAATACDILSTIRRSEHTPTSSSQSRCREENFRRKRKCHKN